MLDIVRQFLRIDGMDVQQVSDQTWQCRFNIFPEDLVILIDLPAFLPDFLVAGFCFCHIQGSVYTKAKLMALFSSVFRTSSKRCP
jgi:hypothetical protein